MADQIAAHGGGQKLNLEQGHAFIFQEWGVLGNCHWAMTVFKLYFFSKLLSQTENRQTIPKNLEKCHVNKQTDQSFFKH